MKFTYPSLLQANSITEDKLPADIQLAVAELHLLEHEYEAETDDEEIEALKKDLRELDRQICSYIRDEFDEESDEDLPATEVKIQVLAQLYQTGLRQVKLSHLRSLMPLSSESKWTEKYGDYTITKRKFEEVVHLSKHN